MFRLLRISLNSAIFSFVPILSWILLGILVDSNLSNVFTLTYPLQFIWAMLKSVFATGANICSVKRNDKNYVLSGMSLGIIFGFIIFGFIALNIDSYISFMNMDVGIYREFALYSVIQLFIHLVFTFVLEKLYYEDKDKLANKYCLTLNLLNLLVLVLSSIIFESKILIVLVTLLSIFIYIFFVTIKQYEKFKLRINMFEYFKYDSVEFVNNMFFFFIFLFGLSNALNFGVEFAVVINFVALITDTQWDALSAITTTSQIDISKSDFNYKKHIRNAYKLLGILLSTTFIMAIVLYNFYELDIRLFIIFLSMEIINFIIYPVYRIKTIFLQLEYSAIKTTTNKICSSTLRMFMSLLKTPFCTSLGQIVSSVYQFISINIMFNLNYKINNSGFVEKK